MTREVRRAGSIQFYTLQVIVPKRIKALAYWKPGGTLTVPTPYLVFLHPISKSSTTPKLDFCWFQLLHLCLEALILRNVFLSLEESGKKEKMSLTFRQDGASSGWYDHRLSIPDRRLVHSWWGITVKLLFPPEIASCLNVC